MIIWKHKLAARHHDPPEKACDYSPEHGKRAEHYAQCLRINLAEWQKKSPTAPRPLRIGSSSRRPSAKRGTNG